MDRIDGPAEMIDRSAAVSGNQESDSYDFGSAGSDYGDLYVDPMDVDMPPINPQASGPLQEADSLDSGGTDSEGSLGSWPEAETSDTDIPAFEDDREEPFHFDVPDCPIPARELFDFLPVKSFWKPFLLVEPMDGILRDVCDGRIWKEARAKDGSHFFSPPDSDSLRIGLILHFDGFGGEQSMNGSSYSSGVLSFSLANLPVHLRYKPSNLVVVALSPGPKESTCGELQHLFEAMVDDLVRLYEEEIEVKTRGRLNARKVQVYCIADGCNHPAMCRVAGFVDHSHLKLFCTRCKIPRDELNSMRGVTGSYPARTGDEHRLLARRYRAAEPGDEEGQCEDLFKKHGTRYYAMSRLTYFDAVRMSAIDPMHNILLSLCKSQWLDSWIHKNVLRERTRLKRRELDQIHAYLSMFEMPSWVGRLPHQVRYPAGGSLSADEYKALVLVYCLIIIPLLWREWQPLAQAEFNKAIEKWEANERDPTTESYERPRHQMHPDDAQNFLKLAAALKIVLGHTVCLADLDRAETLLKEYLEGYLTIHPMDVKPNHHWVLHIFEQIHDFGPVYGFWTFTGERLNKVLKTLQDMLHSLSEQEDDNSGLSEVAKLLSREEKDTRGTVASMNLVNQEVEE
ncbi:hypothetical protein ACEPAI_6903 [Sanghuangporus weigelae]